MAREMPVKPAHENRLKETAFRQDLRPMNAGAQRSGRRMLNEGPLNALDSIIGSR
jgi:hypothetical protein